MSIGTMMSGRMITSTLFWMLRSRQNLIRFPLTADSGFCPSKRLFLLRLFRVDGVLDEVHERQLLPLDLDTVVHALRDVDDDARLDRDRLAVERRRSPTAHDVKHVTPILVPVHRNLFLHGDRVYRVLARLDQRQIDCAASLARPAEFFIEIEHLRLSRERRAYQQAHRGNCQRNPLHRFFSAPFRTDQCRLVTEVSAKLRFATYGPN